MSFSIAISVLLEYVSSALKRVVRTPSRRETRVDRAVWKLGSTMPWTTAVRPISVRYSSMIGVSSVPCIVEDGATWVPECDGGFEEIPINLPSIQQRDIPYERRDVTAVDWA
ncbi:hypothetical protein CDL15_Pgr024724 [Punica granatum]|uniref:Uncharacterized protein n=1 Tax=Punica granatum TaxID=22663 RepID=A0A218W540_PUNGR|nr:hypothetical protein CDL15_Pgr024724 [Punica granatum]